MIIILRIFKSSLAFMQALIVSGALLLTGCSSTSTANKITVVAGENPWGIIAKQLGGNQAEVISLIQNPNVDPHLFEASAQDAALVSKAQIVIINGLGYDTFMNQMLSSSGNNPIVLNVSDLLGIKAPGSNPHLWYRLKSVDYVATTLTNDYIKLNPSMKSYFLSRLKTFENQISDLQSEINYIKSHFYGYPVAYTEPVAQYLLNEAGLKNITPPGFAEAIENGVSPSPAATLAMQSIITKHDIKLLIYNLQTVSKITTQIQNLALSNKIKVVGVTETVPLDFSSYYSWQAYQIKEIIKALKND